MALETGQPYKVHKSYIWLGPTTAMVAVVVVGALNSIPELVKLGVALQGGGLPVDVLLVVVAVLLGLVVLFGALVGLYALAWRNMSYVFDEREFSFYSGIITKRRVHVPYGRIQSVNHRASIIQRIVGVCTVTIDSAGGSSNKAVRVPYLTLEAAEQLRGELFARKGRDGERELISLSGRNPAIGESLSQPEVSQSSIAFPNALDQAAGAVGEWRGAAGGAAFVEEAPSYELGLSNSELLFTALSHDLPVVLAGIIGFSFLVTVAICMLVQDVVALFIAAFAWPIIIGGALVTWTIGFAAVALSYGGFRARRRGSRVEVERGILSREFSGIDIGRVQSVEVRQSFIRRLMGYCEVSLGRIDTASEQNSGNNNSKANTRGLVIHPFVRLDRVDAIVDGLVPEFADRPRIVDCEKLPRPARRRAWLRRCLWFNWALWAAVVIVACWGALHVVSESGLIRFASSESHAQFDAFLIASLALVAIVCALITAVRGIGANLWARYSGYAWNRWFLLVHNDGLSTATSIVPRNKIQAATTRDNPFQRRLDLTTLRAITAAGVRSTTVRLVDVPAETGSAYLEWCE